MSLRTAFKAMAGINPLDMGLLVRDWKTVVRFQFLQSAFESGLLTALDRPRSREELLDGLAVERPDILDALLDVGLAQGEIKLTDGRYRLSGRRSRLLAREAGDGLAAIVQATNSYYNDIYRRAPERMTGAADGDYLDHIGDLVARAARVSEPFIRAFIGRAVKGRGPMDILEIGCGSGGHLREAWLANPEVRGLGVDIDPTVVPLARTNMEKWNLTDRFQVFEADILNPGPELDGPFDLITLYNLVYYFDDPTRERLFRLLAARLKPGGAVAAASNFQGRGRDVGSANLNIATCSMDGCHPLPGVDKVADQLRSAGLDRVETKRLMPGSAMFGLLALAG